jgi:hypothetical protein
MIIAPPFDGGAPRSFCDLAALSARFAIKRARRRHARAPRWAIMDRQRVLGGEATPARVTARDQALCLIRRLKRAWTIRMSRAGSDGGGVYRNCTDRVFARGLSPPLPSRST